MEFKIFCYLILSLSVVYTHENNNYEYIMKYMNKSVDPCNDYYQYACGNMNGNEPILAFEAIEIKANNELQSLLQKIEAKQLQVEQHAFVRKFMNYYKSCKAMRDEKFEPKKYLNWLQLHESISWPTPFIAAQQNIIGKKAVKQEWLPLLASLRKYGLNSVFFMENGKQTKSEPDNFHIIMGSVKNFEPFDSEHFYKLLEYFESTKPQDSPELWNEISIFEQKLQLMVVANSGNTETNTRQIRAWEIPWLERYFQLVLEDKFNATTRLQIENINYFRDLMLLLDDYESEFLRRYIMLRFVDYMKETTASLMTDKEDNECLLHTAQMFPLAINWLYEKYNAMDMKGKADIVNIFQNLKIRLKVMLPYSMHLNSSQLDLFNTKLKSMLIKLEHAPQCSSTDRQEEFHKDLNITIEDYYSNYLQLLRLLSAAQHQPQHQHVALLLENCLTPARSNSELISIRLTTQYEERFNLIIVQLNIARTSAAYKRHITYGQQKYGKMAYLLAAQILKSLDASLSTAVELINTTSLRMRLAYEVTLALNSAKTDEEIQGISSTNLAVSRLFFIGYAQMHCVAANSSQYLQTHDKVVNTLKNFVEFGRTYNCAANTPMNPEKKFFLW